MVCFGPVEQIVLTERCSKNGGVPRSPLPKNGSLMTIEPLIPPAKLGGGKRWTDMRAVMNGPTAPASNRRYRVLARW
jgi:hypothetical protein